MPVPFRIRLIRASDGVEETCSGEIPDADWRLLTTFWTYAKDLESAEWVQAGLDADYSIQPGENGESQILVRHKPSDAAVSQLLHRMRPFLLQNEDTFYTRVNKTLARHLTHKWLRDWLAIGRRIFDHGQFRVYGQITVNDLPLHDERTFGLWLNAFEYHRDQAKRAQLIESMGGPPDDFVLAIFRAILADRATEVLRLATMIDKIERAPAN